MKRRVIEIVDAELHQDQIRLVADADIGEQDDLWEVHGLRVVVDAESAPFLAGTTVDYSDTLNDAGFKVNNPKASTTCGCGESFNVV